MRNSFLLIAFMLLLLTSKAQVTESSETNDTSAKTYAMIIGISNYKFIQPLDFADKDAGLFRDFLKSAGGGNLKSDDIFCLLNEEAKAANFWVKGMNWLRSKNLKKNDRLFIYMAGHGDAINQDEYFFLTYDCNPAGDKNNYIITGNIQLYNLKSRIADMVRKGIEVVLVMDACRSNELPGGTEGQQTLNSAISEKNAGEMVMLATGAGQESLEDANIGTGHGLFTYYLVDGLSGIADTKGDADQKISFKELESYVGSNVPLIAQEKYKRKQDPYFCCEEFGQKNIAIVDSSFMRKWATVKGMKNLSGNEMDAIARGIKTRGLDSIRTDTLFLETYHRFNKAVQDMKLIGGDGSAESYFNELSTSDPTNILTREAKATLAAELINYAQTKINLYLQGKDAAAVQQMRSQLDDEENSEEITVTLDRMERVAKQDFSLTGVMLEKALKLLDLQDSVIRNSLEGKVYFFKAHGFFDKGNKTMDYLQALKFAQLANTFDNGAAYTLNTISSLYIQKEQYDSAVYYATKAITVAPKWRYPYLNNAYSFYKLNLKDSALKYYRQAVIVDPSNADAFVDLGRFYHHMRKMDSAEILYEKALTMEPENVYANNNMGWLLKEKRQFKTAIEHFKKSVNADPLFFSAYNGLSKVYSELKQFDSARYYYEKALQQYPDKMLTTNYLGNFYKESKQYDSALYYYRQAINYDLSDNTPYINIAKTYSVQKKYDSAVYYYRQATRVGGANAFALNQLGLYYKDRHKYDSAVYYFSQALDVRPNWGTALNNLALAYYDQKKYDVANEYFRKGMEKDSTNAALFNNAGLAYKEAFKLDSAKQFFSKAIELNPSILSAYINLGWLYRQQRKYDSAKYVFLKGVETNPFNADMANNLILLYTYLNQFDSAKIYYQRNISQYPNNPSMLNNFGNFYFNIKSYDSAIVNYKKALALDPDYAIAYNNIGAVYNEITWYDSAVYFYSKAVALDPEYVNAYFNMGVSFLNNEEYDSAIVNFNKSIQLNPEQDYYYYFLACGYSLKKQMAPGIKNLTMALEKGYKDFYEVLHDEDLEFIRSSKEYDQLVKKYVPQKFIDQMNEQKKKALESAKQSTTSVDETHGRRGNSSSKN
jgi:tetratricopeptide (TPR) repeat protein